MAAISYDSDAILKVFSDRRKIEFPLLSDTDSKTIRAYRVLNNEAVGPFKGMARPGYFYIDPKGIIREKFFKVKYRQRLTGNNVIEKLFPELGEEVTNRVEAPHLDLAMEQSDRTAFPGEIITLTAQVELPPGVHVYAPGVQGYHPIKLVLSPAPDFSFGSVVYPQSRILYLPVIKERVAVFEGKFRISQDVRVSSAAAFSRSLGPDGKAFKITGKLEYQACDSKICYLPTTARLEWQLHVMPLDTQRAPEDIRHK